MWTMNERTGRERTARTGHGTLWDIAGRTTRPRLALANLLERHRLFTDRLRERTDELGLPAMVVDGSVDETTLVAAVADRFGFGSSPPREVRE